MSGGSTNFFTSRRTNFIRCEYWNVANNKNIDKNILVNETQITGTFYAKIENNTISDSSNIVAQTFMFDSKNMTISTNDNITDLKKNAVIRLTGIEGLWRVDNVERIQLRSNYQYHLFENCKTILNIRR